MSRMSTTRSALKSPSLQVESTSVSYRPAASKFPVSITSTKASKLVSPAAGAITLPRTASESCCKPAPGRSSSDRASV